ncbi:MAG: DsrE/DsrF/DrsH-like family protein [Alphaproteobacteria bacterium]|nr:DsrE/DsrF/DrsH-like family protein [Alphaproteobacteria bacterium]MCB9696707.1 DsrE/DsrF/DrsH-like family protein [Alphaproteobacteria bacterium]
MPFPFQAEKNPQENRRIALICAKGGLDECYPVLIMANAARMVGIDTSIFFTFYGLDVVTESRVDHLYVNMVGNPASPIPPMLAGLPGMESLGAHFMAKKMTELDLPGPREMIRILHDSGTRMYGCELAMKMFGRTEKDLLPEVEAVITATDFFEKTVGADIIFV